MTQEEKARAYDEALKRADSLTEKYGGREFAEYVFPELNESDDERIRKKIIENVRLSGGYTDEEIDEMISWLEKQKEQKPAEWSEEEVLNRTYEEGFNDGLKYGKPVKRSDEDKKMSDWLIGIVNANTELSFKDKVNLTRWLEHSTIEKELSKNDKRIMDAIMIGYQDKDFRSSQIPTPIGVSKDEVIAWLKSLRPQQKVEWSEEDENARQNLIAHFEGKILKLSGEAKKEAVDWLKSLRPSWKPSEEQMEALNALNLHGDLSYVGQQNQLISLYQDLKKLM